MLNGITCIPKDQTQESPLDLWIRVHATRLGVQYPGQVGGWGPVSRHSMSHCGNRRCVQVQLPLLPFIACNGATVLRRPGRRKPSESHTSYLLSAEAISPDEDGEDRCLVLQGHCKLSSLT
ncbi:hypothetical protein mRhiFer1_008544 [Rhinolophus ferrumequinum]|uniref:Uncharacterized protein n=1 Tax=Rhinolophus ferrumequinum TaxID=59479 RepID=A0A7J7UJL8_RHIFE|nr:hypothetical protein mRhiFer1_008544 [Rhinolophus ferrumequinum]